MSVRAKHLALLAIALAALTAPVRASCAAPWLSIDGGPSTLRVGQTLTIRGEGGWGDFPCNDTGGSGDSSFGCGGEQQFEDDGTGEPDQNIEIRLYGPLTARQEKVFDARGHRPRFNRYVILDNVDANADGYFEIELKVPDVEPGRYVIDTPLDYDDAYPLSIEDRSQARGRPPLRGTPLAQFRHKAVADGRIDRREAIRLAIGVRKMRLTKAEAHLRDRQGRHVWIVVLYEKLGCHYTHTIDASTGRPVGASGGGCY